jgi:hypothetical protein
MNLSRELASIYTFDFVISLYLIFLIGVQTSDITGLKLSAGEPNKPLQYYFSYLSSAAYIHIIRYTCGSSYKRV